MAHTPPQSDDVAVDLSLYRKLRSEHRWSMPEQFNIATDVCDKHAPDKLAMIWTDGQAPDRYIYWNEIQDLSARCAAYYATRGVEAGDRVAVLMAATPESTAALLGVLKIGAIAIPMSPLWSDESLVYRLEDADARLLVTDARNSVRTQVRSVVPECLVLDPDGLRTIRAHPAAETRPTSPHDPALLYYTSGSTGLPKGVLAPHRSLLGHNEFEYCQDLRDGERSYWLGDWAWGVYKILGPWRHAAVNVVYATDRRFDPADLLRTLSRLKVENIFLNPTGLRLMKASVPDAGNRFPQRFRIACCANERLGSAEAEWFEQQFGLPILEAYGMTEAYPMVGNMPGIPRKPGSMGLPIPGWDVAILDEDEQPVSPNEAGEICLRARSNPQYPLGYWNRRSETQADFGGAWFHTKDLARADADGYFYHLGRKDDVIKSAGYRISPFEVEEACCRHPAVHDAGVIGVSDEARGQQVKAYIVPTSGQVTSSSLADDIKKFVKAEHSAFGYPRVIEFVDTLPRGQSGKLTRAELRARPSAEEH